MHFSLTGGNGKDLGQGVRAMCGFVAIKDGKNMFGLKVEALAEELSAMKSSVKY